MPVDFKPLFRPEAIQPKLRAFTPPPKMETARDRFAKWSAVLAKSGKEKKETELLADFMRDTFVDFLGYVPPPAEHYTFRRELHVEVDGKFADAALGRFNGEPSVFTAVLEGKGPKDPLDQPFSGRKRSAVEQALQYAVQLQVDWYLVTNMREIRLFNKSRDMATYERFETQALAEKQDELKRFAFLLGADRVLGPAGNHLDALLVESTKIGKELTDQFYRDFRQLRETAFEALLEANPGRNRNDLLTKTQKILDRILFIAFCEDRELIPADIIARAYRHSDPFDPKPIWRNFVSLFRSVNQGNPGLNITRYNGGLFADDEALNGLVVPDKVCELFKRIAEYEYGRPEEGAKFIDVDILGHIFEQSITDLEEMHRSISAPKAAEIVTAKASPSKRKREGAFYTPDFITRYIVGETLGPVLRERFESYRRSKEESAPAKVRGLKAILADPIGHDPAKFTEPQREAMVDFWHGWIDELQTVRIVDPSCGSGAFLIEAFEQMFAEYEKAQSFLSALVDEPLLDVKRTILTNNIFGMDLNAEAVEIARLSAWIKTAERGKVLTTLDDNIQQGNSVVAQPSPLDAWKSKFPQAFADGGFDVVIGNPPYVRQEWIKEFKPHWRDNFASYSSTADLFIYFYELGIRLLKPGGRLGYITSGAWVRGTFAEPLREFLTTNAGLESMIDFGEFQPFADAEMIRPTILIASKRQPGGRMKLWKWLGAGRPPEMLSDEISKAPWTRTDHLGRETWELETDEVISLRLKLAEGGVPASRVANGAFYRGVTTGANEVFVIDEAMRRQLIDAHPSSAEIIKPFVQGTNLREWYVDYSGEYLIFPRRGIRIEEYPAILEYLAQHRTALEPKPDGWDESHEGQTWPGRKPGSYKWYEIQDSVDYWEAFETPKIVWPDITNRPRFSMDLENRYLGNTGYLIPGGDYYLLAVLSSWSTWFFISKTAQPLRLRSGRWQYRLIAQFMENVPIPDAPASDREALGKLAERCSQLGMERYRIEEQVRHRLTTTYGTAGGAKLNEKSQEWWSVPFKELGDALKTSFKLKRNPFSNPAAADEWEPYMVGKRSEVESLRRQLADAEAEINDRVFRLFNLTADEVKLLLKEVEH